MLVDIKTKESKEMFSNYSIKDYPAHKKRITFLDWNHIGNKLVSSSSDGSIKTWKFEKNTLEKLSDLKGHSESVYCVKYSPKDDNIIISCSNDKTIKFWNTKTNKCIHTEKTKTACKYFGFNYNPNINEANYHLLLQTKDEDCLLIYNMNKLSSSIVKIYSENKNKISDFDFDYNNNLLITISSISGLICFYSLDKYELLTTIDITHSHLFNNTFVRVDNKTKTMITGGNDALVTFWNTDDMMSYKVVKKTDYCIKKAKLSYDSRYLVSIYDEPLLDIFDCDSDECVYFNYRKYVFSSITWNPSMNVLAFNGEDGKLSSKSDDGIISIFSLVEGKEGNSNIANINNKEGKDIKEGKDDKTNNK